MKPNDLRKVIYNLRNHNNIEIRFPKKDGCFNLYLNMGGVYFRVSTLEKNYAGVYSVKMYPFIDTDYVGVSVRKLRNATYIPANIEELKFFMDFTDTTKEINIENLNEDTYKNMLISTIIALEDQMAIHNMSCKK